MACNASGSSIRDSETTVSHPELTHSGSDWHRPESAVNGRSRVLDRQNLR
jgi:hypothetical protein